MSEVKLFPAWKNAVKSLIEMGIDIGMHISKKEIADLCGLKEPQDIPDVQRFNMELLTCTDNIKKTLLKQRRLWLEPTNRGGYVVVHPKDQTRIVVDAGIKAISREMKRMAMGATFIRSDLLTDEQRSRNADAQAKISRLADMLAPAKSELRQLTHQSTHFTQPRKQS